jgi:hypothetical protein
MHKTRIAVIFLVAGPTLVCGACGSGASDGGSTTDSGSAATDASGEAQWSSPGTDGSSPDGGSQSTTGSASDGGVDAAAEASTESDAAAPVLDGAVGDAALQPYKGVAGNSTCSELGMLEVSWWYNWETGPGSCKTTPFVPMVWGHTGSEQTASGIASEVSSAVSAGYSYILGFNEPDNTSQSNISVATAISLWPSFKNPSLRVGAPATQGNSAGLTWIKNFMSQVNADTTGTLQVDFIATHWYGWNAGSCDAKAANLESWIAGIEAIPGNRPIWLTEWGCLNASNPDAATVQAFYTGAIAMFAKHPRLERYAWYQFTTNNELVYGDGGGLTPLGTAYAAAPASR